MTLGAGADQIDLYYFGRGHTNGDAWVVFPALRVDARRRHLLGQGCSILDANNGGSGVDIGDTLAKAPTRIKNVDTIITGHSPDDDDGRPAGVRDSSTRTSWRCPCRGAGRERAFDELQPRYKVPARERRLSSRGRSREEQRAQVIADELKEVARADRYIRSGQTDGARRYRRLPARLTRDGCDSSWRRLWPGQGIGGHTALSLAWPRTARRRCLPWILGPQMPRIAAAKLLADFGVGTIIPEASQVARQRYCPSVRRQQFQEHGLAVRPNARRLGQPKQLLQLHRRRYASVRRVVKGVRGARLAHSATPARRARAPVQAREAANPRD